MLSGGDLQKHLEKHGALTERTAASYARQLLDGLGYLHYRRVSGDDPSITNIIHSDIKPANLFLCGFKVGVGFTVIKLGDFDDPVTMQRTVTTVRDIKSVPGSLLFMAPEICRRELENNDERKKVGRKADVYSFGCTVLKMLLGRELFRFSTSGRIVAEDELDNLDHYFAIMNGGGMLDLPGSLPKKLHELIHSCVQTDPLRRPNVQQLTTHYQEYFSQAHLPSTMESDNLVAFDDAPISEATYKRLLIPERYWQNENRNAGRYRKVSDLLTLDFHKCAYEMEFIYELSKLQRENIYKPVCVRYYGTDFLQSGVLHSLRDYIFKLDVIILEEAYLDLTKENTVYPQLVALRITDERNRLWCSTDDILRCVPRLKSLVCLDSCFRPGTNFDFLRRLDHCQWIPQLTNRQQRHCLYLLDQSEQFVNFRQFLGTLRPEVLRSKKSGALWKFGNCLSARTNVEADSSPEEDDEDDYIDNFLMVLGQKELFAGTSSQLQKSLRRRLNLPRLACLQSVNGIILTRCPCSHDHFSAEITGNFREQDLAAFWLEAETAHPSSLHLKRAVVFRDQLCKLSGPLQVHADLVVLRGFDRFRTEQFCHWSFTRTLELSFIDCDVARVGKEHLKKAFPLLRSLVFLHSVVAVIEENVFSELRFLEHVTLDGPDLLSMMDRGDWDSDFDFEQHLRSLHLNPAHRWLREYLKQNGHLVEDKSEAEIPSDLQRSYHSESQYAQKHKYTYTPSENFADIDIDVYRETGQLKIKTPTTAN